MQTKDIIKKVEQYVMPIIEKNNYELVETEFVKEGANYYLRLYIDKEGGFSINDCEIVSRYLEEKLEEDDFIDKAYILEVSSPGIDRVLKKDSEYQKYKGRIVDIKLYKPIDKVKEFQGELVGLIDDKIVVCENEKEISFDKKDVAVCRLAVIF
ncbi:ribosome maturation factor RimP [[Clostridium] colinum]|uniref:ribosome maturation factor RimP n=1 Tax=[Clostridium] colinum TaxID=36835 RepID=UPI00202579EC|nr:ribosome maturation factor RimP [[Clostridium] colinum]